MTIKRDFPKISLETTVTERSDVQVQRRNRGIRLTTVSVKPRHSTPYRLAEINSDICVSVGLLS